jgi:pyruvate, orthophosphate dikinase
MMDTVLNLGLNDAIIGAIASRNGDRFAYDSYRRLLDMYADVVLGADRRAFEEAITDLKVGLVGHACTK